MMKWIHYSQTMPQGWVFKSRIPKEWQPRAVQVQFLFCKAWIVRDENRRVYMPDGQWAETLDFRLNTPGHVIGLRDMTTADAYAWAGEWKAAMHDRIVERLDLSRSNV